LDTTRYQTVFARTVGAVAAPTAGLHLTNELLTGLAQHGIGHTFITLHVGPGTFRPVKSEHVENHVMDAERYEISADSAQAIAECRARGGRVVAVGSTTVRTLESVAAQNDGNIVADTGNSELFIRPPYDFKVVDAMLTNFHLPKSTLLMMVAALAGREYILDAYKEAVRSCYRFFSYGDCMLIL
jgi:S-adenosylmethionine:tRNA ribosyltransferase-isomerase